MSSGNIGNRLLRLVNELDNAVTNIKGIKAIITVI
jgi:hypothetical protein